MQETHRDTSRFSIIIPSLPSTLRNFLHDHIPEQQQKSICAHAVLYYRD